MRKKVLSLMLVSTMVAGCLAGCGDSGNSSNNSSTGGNDSSGSTSEASNSNISSDGKTLNIYCWNEEFKSRITDHYADYSETSSDLEENDDGDVQGTVECKIGDVKVVWHITPLKTMHTRMLLTKHC